MKNNKNKQILDFAKEKDTGICLHDVMDLIDSDAANSSSRLNYLTKAGCLEKCFGKQACSKSPHEHQFYVFVKYMKDVKPQFVIKKPVMKSSSETKHKKPVYVELNELKGEIKALKYMIEMLLEKR